MKNSDHPPLPVQDRLTVPLALACVGAAGAAALAWFALTGADVPGCSGASGCRNLLFSRWAHAYGQPVTIWAAALYLVVAMLCWGDFGSPDVRRLRVAALRCLALTIGLAAVWFVGLQALALRQFCLYCLALHAWGLIVATAVWRCVQTPRDRSANPPRQATVVAGAATAIALLVVGHFVGQPPRTDRVTAYAYGKGQIRLTSEDAPILGDPQAQCVILELFDYTCATCRALAPQLAAAQTRYGPQLAILAVPCPLEATCNPHLEQMLTPHEGACEYARLAAAVWLAAPQEFAGFHNWLLQGEQPPALAAARAHARQLAGGAQFDEVANDHRVDRLLARGVDLYRGLGRGSMPKLLLGDRLQQGAPRSEEDLFDNLERYAGLQLPATTSPEPPGGDARLRE